MSICFIGTIVLGIVMAFRFEHRRIASLCLIGSVVVPTLLIALALMKYTVTDEAVHEYAERIRNSVPLGTLFPGKMSDCEFTNQQREVIRSARAGKKNRIKHTKRLNQITVPEKLRTETDSVTAAARDVKSRPLTKLRKMLYLQSNRCFFCGEILKEEDASIEHLMPLSKGGVRSEDNEVVCHKSLNETFGQMDLKSKVDFIIKQLGDFECPKTTE